MFTANDADSSRTGGQNVCAPQTLRQQHGDTLLSICAHAKLKAPQHRKFRKYLTYLYQVLPVIHSFVLYSSN